MDCQNYTNQTFPEAYRQCHRIADVLLGKVFDDPSQAGHRAHELVVRDSSHFLEKVVDLRLEPGDMLINFDVVSLFTMVPVQEVLVFIREVFSAEVTSLTSRLTVWRWEVH